MATKRTSPGGPFLEECSQNALLETVPRPEREFFIKNLLVQIHVIIVIIEWTGLAPWEVEFPFPCCLTSTFLGLPPKYPRPRPSAPQPGFVAVYLG